MVLYPMFVHMYLELVYKGSEKEGEYIHITYGTFLWDVPDQDN